MNYLPILGAALIFIIIVSVDLFVCGFGYGASKIHVPFRKVLVINIIGTVMIGIGLFAGYFLSSVLNESIATWLAFGVLFGLGLYKVAEWFFVKRKTPAKEIRPISWRETIILAVALSLDGLAIGIATTVDNWGLVFIITVLSLSLITDIVFFTLGQRLGKRAIKNIKLDLAWISGVLLMGLAIVGLFI